jgi:hypothetical protein
MAGSFHEMHLRVHRFRLRHKLNYTRLSVAFLVWSVKAAGQISLCVVSIPKILSDWIRIPGQNRRIIRRDAYRCPFLNIADIRNTNCPQKERPPRCGVSEIRSESG